MSDNKNKKVIVGGIEYDNLTDAYEANEEEAKVPYNSAKARYYRYGYTGDEALFLRKYEKRAS